MFLSYKISVGKLLVGHLLRDDIRLEESVQLAIKGHVWAINPGGLCYSSDSPQVGFQAVAQIHVCVGILGPLVSFDPFREFSLHRLEKYYIFYLLVVGNRGPLMLACSNVHISVGFSIFSNAYSTSFGVSHGFVTPIKGCRVTDSFMSLVGFEFSMDVYG